MELFKSIIKYTGYLISSLFFGIMGILLPYYNINSFNIESDDIYPFIFLVILFITYIILYLKNNISKKFIFFNLFSFLLGTGLIYIIFIIKKLL